MSMATSLTGGAGAAEAAEMERKIRAAAPKHSDWSNLPKHDPLYQLSVNLASTIEKADGYNEMYGIELQPGEETKPAPFGTLLILQKFLRANAGNATKAEEQLLEALKWRKEFQPLKVRDEVFDKTRFGGLGYVTELGKVPGSSKYKDVATFNIYGAVKDSKKTFGDLDGFIRWRVALMEMTIAGLHLQDAKEPIPDYGKGADPYQAFQIHDYLSVSFLRQPAEVKAASSKTIQLFQKVYPETMSKKYFVNVPLFMQWMFAAMQVFMAKETIAKMQWMSYGSELHHSLGSSVPKAYGGNGPDLQVSGREPNYSPDSAPAATETTTPEETAPEVKV